MSYRPAPIDTDAVKLSPELDALVERLAEHAHAVWARERFKEGWTCGAERDDRAKQHPCLVPYEALPEVEKGYDRRVVLETLKAIVALGWRIQAPQS